MECGKPADHLYLLMPYFQTKEETQRSLRNFGASQFLSDTLTCLSLLGSILDTLDERLHRQAAVLTRDARLVLPSYCCHFLLH
jgi:hypothetical protein